MAFPAEWEMLPEPGAPLIMGIDGGYVLAREGHNRKACSFEIIVGTRKKRGPIQSPRRVYSGIY